MVIVTGVEGEALGGAAAIGGDAVGIALAGDGREPAIGDGELRRHEVVVVQEILIVVAHGALAGGIGVSRRNRRRRAAQLFA